MLTLLFSVTGTHLSTLEAKTFDFSSRTIHAPGGRVFIDAIEDAGRVVLPDRIRARIGDESPDALESSLTVDLVRHVQGEDVLSDLADYHFDRSAAMLMGIGKMPEATLPGTVEASGATLTGTGTSFLRDCPPGSRMSIEGEVAIVESVESNTSLTLTQAMKASTSSSPALVQPLYTLAHPRVMAMGVVADNGFKMSNDDASFKVEVVHEGLQNQIVNTYKGFGNGIDMRGAGSADTQTVFDPDGDFTIGIQFVGFLEDVSQASTLMSNGDIELVHLATGKIKGTIETSSGTQTVETANEAYGPDLYTFAHLRWDESEAQLDLLLDGIVVDTAATTGTLNTSGNDWVLGADETKIAQQWTGIFREARLYSSFLDDDTISESIQGPLRDVDLDAPLVLYYTGEAGASNDLFEFASANASSPKDATLVGWERAPGFDAPEIAGTIIPRGLGYLEHLPARNVGLAGATGASNEVWHLADKPLQDVHHVYEEGESGDADAGDIDDAQEIVSRHQTMKSWLDATLTAGQVAAYPKGGAVMLNRIASSDISADVSGESIGVRSMMFDGVTSQINMGTGANTLLATDFTMFFSITPLDLQTDDQYIVSSLNSTATAGIAIIFNLDVGFIRRIRFGVFGLDAAPFALQLTSASIGDSVQPSSTIDFAWTVSKTGGTVSGVLIQDGVEVDSASVSGVTLVSPSTQNLLLGAVPAGLTGSRYKGSIAELAVFDESKTTAFIRENRAKDKTGIAGLVHYYPTRLQSYPVATLIDEVGSLDGTMTDIEWRGGLTPTAGAAIAEHYVRHESAIKSESVDFSGIYQWPTGPLHVYVQALESLFIEDFLYEVINSFNGWYKWLPPEPDVLAGTVSATGAAVTGSGTSFTSIGLPAAISFKEETHSIKSIESDTALTLVTEHQGATSVSAIVHQPKLSFGWIEDPDGASINHSFGAVGQPAVLEIETELTGDLPAEFRQAYRWIHAPGREVSQLVDLERVRLWEKEYRLDSQPDARNQSLAGDRPKYEVLARWVRADDSAAEGRRQKSIYKIRRQKGTAVVQDPLALVRAGDFVRITHTEVEGGVGDFLVREAQRVPSLPEVSLEIWGAEADPAA